MLDMPFQRPKFQRMSGGTCPRTPLQLQCRYYGLPLTKILATPLSNTLAHQMKYVLTYSHFIQNTICPCNSKYYVHIIQSTVSMYLKHVIQSTMSKYIQSTLCPCNSNYTVKNGFQTYVFCSKVSSKCWICRFRDPNSKECPGGHAPGPPYNCSVVTMASPSLKSWLRLCQTRQHIK